MKIQTKTSKVSERILSMKKRLNALPKTSNTISKDTLDGIVNYFKQEPGFNQWRDKPR